MTTRTPGNKAASRAPSAARTQTRKAPAQGTAPRRASAPAAAKPARSGKAGAEVDSPILPVEQLDALRKIKPGAVDWVIEQTQLEAQHRREEQVRVNNLIFVEHMFAQAAALIVAVCAIGGGVWLARDGQPWVGVAMAAAVMAALAVIQVGSRRGRA